MRMMKNSMNLRQVIRQMLEESFNLEDQFISVEQLDDDTTFQIIGDPLFDVELNQHADDQGSDGQNAPTVSVTAGEQKSGHGYEAGQRSATFHPKTELGK